MSEWTEPAMERWACYLDQVRERLAPCGEAETDAVIRDLEEHATRTFSGRSDIVGIDAMDDLILHLGTPSAIATGAVSAATATGVNQSTARDVASPASGGWPDQVLGFTSLALLVIAVLLPATTAGALALAYLLARIVVRNAHDVQDRRKWALLPALAIGALVIAAALFLWPLGLVIPIAAIGGPVQAWYAGSGRGAAVGDTTYWLQAWVLGLVATAVWWVALRALLRRRPALLPLLLFPFVRSGR